jgi:hypothetical protein
LSRKKQSADSRQSDQRRDIDLHQAGDGMLSIEVQRMVGQKGPHSANTRRINEAHSAILRSGWNKPTIQLAMLLGLSAKGELETGGLRRMFKLLATQPVPVTEAAVLRSHIANDSSFKELAIWVNRPMSFTSFKKKRKRRIGVGYRDKGALPPSHSKDRNRMRANAIYLGKKMELLWDLDLETALLIRDYGYLFNHLGGGWWEIDPRLRQHLRVLKLSGSPKSLD